MTAQAPTSALLTLSEVNAWYGAAHVLHHIDLHVGQGEVVALMGRNGAGKSTTLKSIMGLAPKRTGQIVFMGQSIIGYQPYQIARLGLGYVPEDRRIFTDLTVAENLDVGRQPSRYWPDGQAVTTWTADKLYELFPNLATMGQRPASAMSGGEQQMLTVARTLMGNPFLILLDEPSEGIAPVIVEQMIAMILALKAHGASILLAEQNIYFAQLVADRVYVLEKGAIRYSGSMAELTANEAVRQAYLGL
ncbi:ABC transporter ATP-binding protein [Alcaligenaceae bacterium CGII-47]|nr:ABC transporter ATP-binding protein [Alcaligenaceae bacterium CGII-47]